MFSRRSDMKRRNITYQQGKLYGGCFPPPNMVAVGLPPKLGALIWVVAPQIEPTRLHIARISFIRLVICRRMNSDTKSGLIKTNAEKVSPQ